MTDILDAIRDGLISNRVTPEVEKFIFQRSGVTGLEIMQLEGLAINTATTNRQEHSFGLNIPETVPPIWDKGTFIELARVRSLPKYITILRTIDTTITDYLRNTLTEKYSNPFKAGDLVTWYLTLSPINTLGAQRFSLTGGFGESSHKPPGNGFSHLDPWKDNRYNWGNPQNVVTMPIPAGYDLSLWAEVTANQPIFSAWGTGIQYTIGTIVIHAGIVYSCTQSHLSTGVTPPLLPTRWAISSLEDDWFTGGIAGRLTTSYQSEDHLSSNWQAERTFKG